ncbi:MAG: MAPEG family protein [Myxococcota bacterium]
MTPWILAVLALWVVQTILPTQMNLFQSADSKATALDHMRGRDVPSEPTVYAARATRALNNMQEALPVFLAIALLLEIKGITTGLAIQGAIVFLVARILYVPAYLIAILGLRSTVWLGGWVGLAMMIAALLGLA